MERIAQERTSGRISKVVMAMDMAGTIGFYCLEGTLVEAFSCVHVVEIGEQQLGIRKYAYPWCMTGAAAI